MTIFFFKYGLFICGMMYHHYSMPDANISLKNLCLNLHKKNEFSTV